MRQEHAHAVLSKASAFIVLDPMIEKRAKELIATNIKPMDALHLASAEAGDCDFFCTCDDRLLRTARRISDLRTRVVGPAELVQELGI
jgi:predicted nucleic acid-binding protein